jgi:hypothetical protein
MYCITPYPNPRNPPEGECNTITDVIGHLGKCNTIQTHTIFHIPGGSPVKHISKKDFIFHIGSFVGVKRIRKKKSKKTGKGIASYVDLYIFLLAVDTD